MPKKSTRSNTSTPTAKNASQGDQSHRANATAGDEFDPDLTSGFFDDVAGEPDEDRRAEELKELMSAEADESGEFIAATRDASGSDDEAGSNRTGQDRRTGSAGPSGAKGNWSQSGVVDRRLGLDRRAMAESAGKKVDPNRRRGPGRRLSDFTRSAEEGEMTPEQFLFLKAIDTFKKANNKAYPSWTDVLEVVRLLGYRKTMPMELNLPGVEAEDWREAANTPSDVRPVRPEDRENARDTKNPGDKKAA